MTGVNDKPDSLFVPRLQQLRGQTHPKGRNGGRGPIPLFRAIYLVDTQVLADLNEKIFLGQETGADKQNALQVGECFQLVIPSDGHGRVDLMANSWFWGTAGVYPGKIQIHSCVVYALSPSHEWLGEYRGWANTAAVPSRLVGFMYRRRNGRHNAQVPL
jgi:hypothetical protein